MEKALHNLYDALCGWCYAAEALTEVATGRVSGQFEGQTACEWVV